MESAHCYSFHRTKGRLVTSIWRDPGPVATKMPFFSPKFKSAATFSAPAQERNLFFLSMRSARKKIHNLPIKSSQIGLPVISQEIWAYGKLNETNVDFTSAKLCSVVWLNVFLLRNKLKSLHSVLHVKIIPSYIDWHLNNSSILLQVIKSEYVKETQWKLFRIFVALFSHGASTDRLNNLSSKQSKHWNPPLKRKEMSLT